MRSGQASSTTAVPRRTSLLPSGAERAKLRRWRRLKDLLSRYSIAFAGVSVVLTFAGIFFYLFAEAAPMLSSAKVEKLQSYPSVQSQPIFSNLERYGEIGLVVDSTGTMQFFTATTGQLLLTTPLNIPANTAVTSFAKGEPRSGLLAFGLSNGQVIVVRHEYNLSYPNDQRHIQPVVTYPLGEQPLQLAATGQQISALAVQEGARGIALSAMTDSGRLSYHLFSISTEFLSGDTTIQRSDYQLTTPNVAVKTMLVDTTLSHLFLADLQGRVHHFDIRIPAKGTLIQTVSVVGLGQTITAMEFLVGSVSLIIGTSGGDVSQWFLVRNEQNQQHLTHIRDFKTHPAAITMIEPEYSRKGFMTLDAKGNLGIHFATSARTLYLAPLASNLTSSSPAAVIQRIAISPINQSFLAFDDRGVISHFRLENAHPDVSWRGLWNEVWYEGRNEPDYIWQASSGSDEFEAKMSLVPLTVGTLKAAFFAMLFATPLALMGAIYTAYFMAPALRRKVKPTIEVMEALPTVILGFLAGLWLAPFIESHLSAIFAMLLLLPCMMLVTAYLWRLMPVAWQRRVDSGWEVLLLLPVIVVMMFLCVQASPLIDQLLFDGNLRQWLTDQGILYDQRNALVVGIAMGFAVIPTIFSIAEDAIYNVPKHLTHASLALGATAWQTVVNVIVPTASPGIFAAVMVGFGRAVGETMIVLMATGNSPIVNFNIFEGMRTLSANIAVELPETAVGSTHFRILFLAALVLLVFTFIFNTIAELIRQRLRERFRHM